jgi:acetyl esterase/lipase
MPTTWNLPDERPSILDTPPELSSRREFIAARPTEVEPGVTVAPTQLGGVAALVATPSDPIGTVLYFHGGGYRLGSPAGSTRFASLVALATRRRVVVPTYRLAPEHPFPAALHDAVAVYDALSDQAGAGIVAMGDSAGGGLAAALCVACAAAGVNPPGALVLLSPWLDLTVSSASFAARAETDPLFPMASARQAAEQYLQGADPRDRLASPAFAAGRDFPRTALFASTDESLLDDAVGFTAALAGAGVEVTACFEPGRMHAWPAVDPGSAGSTLATIAAWLGN